MRYLLQVNERDGVVKGRGSQLVDRCDDTNANLLQALEREALLLGLHVGNL
jgi:hypothetical protein